MASSTQFFTFLFMFGACSFFLDDFSVEGNGQFPRESTIDGQGSSFFYQQPEYPRDCSEVRGSCSSSVSSGVYFIKPDGYEEPFEAYCDNDVDSGGWTVILRRTGSSVGFKRDWNDFKGGVSDFCLRNFGLVMTCEWKEADDSTITEISTFFTDCNDVYSASNTEDGVYSIRPTGWTGTPFDVFCNMSIDGGNWTVIQRRIDGSTDFYQNWTSYKEGFGDLQHEFWLGNEKLFHLTNQSTYEYRLDYVWSSTSYHHKYDRFRIDDETNKYKVTEVGSRTGTRGKSLHNTLNIEFSTYNQDNDKRSYNCAEGHRGGWWYGGFQYGLSSSSHAYAFPTGSIRVDCTDTLPNGDYNGGKGENTFEHYILIVNVT